MTALDDLDRAATFEAPAFSVAQSLRDPWREASELAGRRRDAGFDEGFTRGWNSAEEQVAAVVDDHRRSADRLAQCAAAFEAATNELDRRDGVALAEIERDVVALAAELAAEIIGREVTVVDQPVLDSLARVAQLLPERGRPTLRVNPSDADTAREAVAEDVLRWTRDVEVVADADVDPGDCVVDVGPCRIDGQLRTAIERMRRILGMPDGNLLASDDDSAQSSS